METFHFKQFSVIHGNSGLKVNTDGLLLGALIPKKEPFKEVLEIGSGCGFVSLMVATELPHADITAIDIEEKAFDESRYNFQQSRFHSQLQAIHTSFEGFNPNKSYDVILSNPPFFVNSLKSDKAIKNQALHTQFDLFEQWIPKIKTLQKANGEFYMILPQDIAERVEEIALIQGYQKHFETLVYSRNPTQVYRKVIGFTLNPEYTLQQNSIYIYQENQYSTEYRALLAKYLSHF
jgi:tRNA1Val (adenine37-N6)-methyltransferase